ncbi:jg19581 [Pararge aegeria aegeria]|uniref:Jg19581 protein n=1 Tax=Pararge aegeria aegeria TaxID=348720 RepID=A0A8S4R3J9_9NEOP|nr:jg19581 [Pararge aegeria aegeria]
MSREAEVAMGGAHSSEKGWTGLPFQHVDVPRCWNGSPALASAEFVDPNEKPRSTLPKSEHSVVSVRSSINAAWRQKHGNSNSPHELRHKKLILDQREAISARDVIKGAKGKEVRKSQKSKKSPSQESKEPQEQDIPSNACPKDLKSFKGPTRQNARCRHV